MSTSESHDDESSSSTSEVEEISDYELEVEEFESLSDGAFHGDVPNTSKKNVASLSAPAPYDQRVRIIKRVHSMKIQYFRASHEFRKLMSFTRHQNTLNIPKQNLICSSQYHRSVSNTKV